MFSLCRYLRDDYQLKTLIVKLLFHLKYRDPTVTVAIYNFLLELIGEINERFLLFVEDLARYLVESLKEKNDQIQGLSRRIMRKVKDLSGEDIEKYLN